MAILEARAIEVAAHPLELGDVIGEGGSAVVYEARRGDETIAVKVLRAELALSERERTRFLEEAERMRRVSHVALVRVLGAGVLPDGRSYLAMPLLSGETLSKRLLRGPLPIADALRHAKTIARAVHAIHQAGMLHRDIKPENVVLVSGANTDASANVAPVLLDFGIARDIGEASVTTVAGQIRGTPAYMAPERFFGSPASVQSDVYELAVLLCCMLSGSPPWGTQNDAGSRLNPGLPAVDLPGDVATVLLRALSTRPEKRSSSAAEWADDLERAVVADPEAEPTDHSQVTKTMAIHRASPVPGFHSTNAEQSPGHASLVTPRPSATATKFALTALAAIVGTAGAWMAVTSVRSSPPDSARRVVHWPTLNSRQTDAIEVDVSASAVPVALVTAAPRELGARHIPKAAVSASASSEIPSASSSDRADVLFQDRK